MKELDDLKEVLEESFCESDRPPGITVIVCDTATQKIKNAIHNKFGKQTCKVRSAPNVQSVGDHQSEVTITEEFGLDLSMTGGLSSNPTSSSTFKGKSSNAGKGKEKGNSEGRKRKRDDLIDAECQTKSPWLRPEEMPASDKEVQADKLPCFNKVRIVSNGDEGITIHPVMQTVIRPQLSPL